MDQLPLAEANQNQVETASSSTSEMGLLDHLRELRRRILIVLASLVVTSSVAYLYIENLFVWLCAPFKESFPGQSLIGTGPAEAFMIKLKVAIFGGLLIAIPVIVSQVWLFVQPALYDQEKKAIIPVALSATVLFFIGVFFCYYTVLPLAFSFFQSQYASIGLEPNIKISDQLSTSLTMLGAFGIMFEMPLIVYILASLGLIDEKSLIGVSRYAIVLIFIIAAVFTPPDVLSQLLMAGPLIVLYGISILVAKIAYKK